MYKLKVIDRAQKDLDAFQGEIFEKIRKRILGLSSDPRPFGAIKLTQDKGYRIRIGDYRILFRIDDTLREVIIYRIKHRKDAYR